MDEIHKHRYTAEYNVSKMQQQRREREMRRQQERDQRRREQEEKRRIEEMDRRRKEEEERRRAEDEKRRNDREQVCFVQKFKPHSSVSFAHSLTPL